MKRAPRLLLPAAPAPVVADAQRPAPDGALLAALRRSRHTLSAKADGRLEGPGARVLLDAGRESQFFLLGEEHGTAQVPQLAAGLFRGLAPAGYRHLAVETGEAVAAAMNRAALHGDAAMASFVDRYWPGVPFYALREESQLLVAAVRAAGGRADVLWGLDYDVMGDRYALRRLREIAPDAAARAAADRALAAADSMLREAVRTRDLGGIMMFAAPESAFAPLRRAYAPAPASEADRVLEELEATLRVNALQRAQRYHEANVMRGGLMKTRFMRRCREAATGAGDTLPRVMLKLGSSHAIRGHGFVGFFDLGNAVHELAELNGGRAFGLMALAGRGTQQAVIDPQTFDYAARPVQEDGWEAPLYQLADPGAWTLYDLRPLRPPLAEGGLGTVDPTLARVVDGFDALVVLSGSGPSTSMAGPPF